MGGTFQISSFFVESLWALQCLQNTLLLSVSFSSFEKSFRQSWQEGTNTFISYEKALNVSTLKWPVTLFSLPLTKFLSTGKGPEPRSLTLKIQIVKDLTTKQQRNQDTHSDAHPSVRLTCREHLLVEAKGNDRYINVSNVRDLRWQVRHCTVDLNCPWNSVTMMDSFSSLCLLQARSAAVWSSRWSFSSSLYRFLSALKHGKITCI